MWRQCLGWLRRGHAVLVMPRSPSLPSSPIPLQLMEIFLPSVTQPSDPFPSLKTSPPKRPPPAPGVPPLGHGPDASERPGGSRVNYAGIILSRWRKWVIKCTWDSRVSSLLSVLVFKLCVVYQREVKDFLISVPAFLLDFDTKIRLRCNESLLWEIARLIRPITEWIGQILEVQR